MTALTSTLFIQLLIERFNDDLNMGNYQYFRLCLMDRGNMHALVVIGCGNSTGLSRMYRKTAYIDKTLVIYNKT